MKNTLLIAAEIARCRKELAADSAENVEGFIMRLLNEAQSEQPQTETLRDRFAMSALTGLASFDDERICPKERLGEVELWRFETHLENAKYCYAMADAMIQQREK